MLSPSDAAGAPARLPPQPDLAHIYRLLLVAVTAVAVGMALWLFGDVLMVVFAAALLATILHGAADLLHRWTGLPFWAALLLVVLVVAGALVGLGLVAGPGLAEQATSLKQALAGQGKNLQGRLQGSEWGKMVLDQIPQALGGAKQGDGNPLPSGVAGSVAGTLGAIFGTLGTLAVVIIAALYLAASPGTYVNGALRLVAPKHRPKAKQLAEAAGHALLAWSAGQALDMLVVGLLSGLGLWALGVPLALVLAVVAALCNFVPYIGAIVGAVPAVIIAFSVGPKQGVETLVLYAAIQFFEGNVMAPLIQRRAVHMPPGVTILSQTGFGALLGLPGLIFATPLTAALLAVGDKATVPLDEADKV
ncbi:AI-2E family transporter [Lichenihabitans sp. Uapishka_5]|uniref:AI-2E family transporter n=1 Tax=Lichenihabitans sp. Uapishka_5 TaxID=3037302 RepID=UPI0029E7EC85|nr:AI-2E family transporter [Lichenihabitans sp. Uapishka_5]MDX7953657.1 AI-2E family transporter [Lichenihabitans sp. Uapishka_5]